jgi:hypothetical protein
MHIKINKQEVFILLKLLHISESQKQKCFTFSRIFMSLQPFAVFIPIAFAFINSSLVKP